MGTRKNIDLGAPESIDDPRVVIRIVEGRYIEAPAGQRLGITVNDADTTWANLEASDHRQRRQAFKDGGMS